MVRSTKDKSYFREHWAGLDKKAIKNPKGMARYAREALKLAKEESKWSAAKASEHLARFQFDHVKEQKKATLFDRIFRRNIPSFDRTMKELDKKKADQKQRAHLLYRELSQVLPRRRGMQPIVYLKAVHWYIRYQKLDPKEMDRVDGLVKEIKRLDPPRKLSKEQSRALADQWKEHHQLKTAADILQSPLSNAEKAEGIALISIRNPWLLKEEEDEHG